MKRQYAKPSLTVHGNVESLTKAVGNLPETDGVFVNGVALSTPTDGSGDLVL